MTLFTTISAALVAAVALLSAMAGSGREVHRPLGHAVVAPSAPMVTRPDTTPLYTEEQSTAGAALFGRMCAECHEKKDIAGTDFRAKWTGRSLFDLFELIRTTMPDSNPGGLSRDEYAVALAYILRMNGLPSGLTTVLPDSAAMQNVKLLLPPPAP